MKKILVLAGISILVLASFVVYGVAQAEDPQPPYPASPGQFDPKNDGWIGRGGWRGHEMMDGDLRRYHSREVDQQPGVLHEYMMESLSIATGLSVEELEAKHDAGQTMRDIAEELGFTVEQFRDFMVEARTTALQNAVADGVIDEEQANWMIERFSGSSGPGFGRGHCGSIGRYSQSDN